MKRGRRPGDAGTREAIVAAARARFAAHGYTATRIRAVAADAGVDPALVHYFFGTKEALFAAVMTLPFRPAEILEPLLEDGLDGLGERLVRRLLGIWDVPEYREPLVAMVRSVTGHDAAATMMRGFVEREVVGRIARALPAPDARLRASLVGSQVVGLLLARYVIGLAPLAEADHDALVAAVGPTLQRYLTEELR
ncbi:MAG TPA: TetR family transcriptional regulator [Solirubrobacteraceae bacterium]|jgi:AcrR family transcriptional regulator